MQRLKLVALDHDDLGVISAHLQDAVLKVGDMAYLPKERRFAAVANRFDWQGALKAEGKQGRPFERSRVALRFERVESARLRNLRLDAKDTVLSLLAIQIEPTDLPAGLVTLTFAGGAAIQLTVECVEAELRDLGATWRTGSRPRHPTGEESTGNGPAK